METVAIQNITVDELEKMIERIVTKCVEDIERKDEWCMGAKELSKRLGLGITTISRNTNNGKFNGCYKRIGRKIMYNVTKIQEL